jgi:hypothetical protein
MMWNGRLGALNNCAGVALTVARSGSGQWQLLPTCPTVKALPLSANKGPFVAMHRVFFLPFCALTTCSLRANSGAFKKSAQVRGFSPPQGEDRPNLSQRMGA